MPGQPGVFNILGSHTYKEEGGYDMVIIVDDKGGSHSSNSNMFNVADAAVKLSGAVQINGTEGLSTGVVTVATIQDGNPNAPASDFANNVSINWGDGNAGPGTLVSQGNGTFLVQGSNTYAEEGQYTINVSAYDVGGSATEPVNVGADIKDAPISLTPQPVGVVELLPTGTMTIATLNDTNTSNTDATDFYGTFECSDGTGGQLSFVNESPGVFTVQIPSDTFPDEGTYNVSYTANDVGGAQPATASTTIAVAEGAMAVSLASPIIQGSTDGKTNLTPMTLTTHVEPLAAWALEMSEGDAAKIDVWTMAQPGPNDQPLLGLVNGKLVTSATWGPGVQVPSPLYVGAYHGSNQVGDLQFVLAEADSNSVADAATSPTYTAVRARITSALDPNNDGMTDLTDQTRNLLVGQMVHDTVTLEAPSAWQSGAAYSWGTPSGVTLYSYDPSTSVTVGLSADNGPLGSGGVETGTSQKDVYFLWVTVPDNNLAALQVTTTVQGQTLQPIGTTVNVQLPLFTIGTPTAGTAVVGNTAADNTGDWLLQAGTTSDPGFGLSASVQLPGWANGGTDKGNWAFTQTINSDDHIALGTNHWYAVNNGLEDNDGGFPTAVANIFDGSGNHPTSAMLAPGDQTWTFKDTPQDNLTQPHPTFPSGQTLIDDEIRNDKYKTYVMFLPPGTGGQWVPLRYVSWEWNVEAVKDTGNTPPLLPNGHWQLSQASTGPSASEVREPTGEPSWAHDWQLTQWFPNQIGQ